MFRSSCLMIRGWFEAGPLLFYSIHASGGKHGAAGIEIQSPCVGTIHIREAPDNKFDIALRYETLRWLSAEPHLSL